MAQLFKNNAKSTLLTTITSGSTSVEVQSGDGAKFPSISGSDYFLITLDDGTNVEVMKVTAIASDTMTVTRAQEGTTAVGFTAGAKVELRLTAASVWPNGMVRETFSNAAYTIAGTADRYLAQTGTLTAARTITLPAANGRAGQMIIITDESGSVTASNKLTISRAGTDTIGPGASATSFDMVSPGTCRLISDGNSKWMLVQLSNQKLTYTSGTTAWTCPPGVYAVRYSLQAGGGGGGGTAATSQGGAGGGGGERTDGTVAVSPGTSYNVVIGGGGSAGSTTPTDGGNGGNTTFGGTLVVALGGSGGANSGNTSDSWCHGVTDGNGTATKINTLGLGGASTAPPQGYGGNSGNNTSSSARRGGGQWGYAGGSAGGGTSTQAGGGGGAGGYGNGANGGAGGGTGASGSAPSANTGAGGGGAGSGSSARSGGNGGSGYAELYWSI